MVAAGAVVADCGLAADRGVVIHSGSNVLVHLRLAPVVARVMTGTVALHDDPSRWLSREISVLEFLAPTGLTVSPSRLVEPGPHCRDGLWMTFTEWIPGVAPAPDGRSGVHVDDARQPGAALRRLHDHLRPYDGGPIHWDVASAAGSLRIHGADGHSVRVMLDAYGWDDARELDPFLAAQDVYDEIWRMYDRQRREGPGTLD